MSIAFHLVLLAVYVAAAAAVGVFAPAVVPTPAESGSFVFGGMALALLALVHAIITGLGVRRAGAREAEELRAAYDDVRYELSVARAEARQIHDAILEAGKSGTKSKAMAAVVDEVKVLKGLIERLATSRAEHVAPAVETMPEPAMAGAVAGPADRAGPRDPLPLAGAMDDDAVLALVQQGLEENRIDLYLQPVVSLPQRRRRFYECFSRIRDAHGQVILPEQYIRLAERDGLVTVIDNILLFRCVQLVRRTRKLERNVQFFYNMSPRTLADTTFFPEFLAFLEENPELASSLLFEFTQADIAELSPEATENLAQLGERGFRFSLDQVTRLDMNFGELSRRYFRYVKVDALTLLDHLRAIEDEGRLTEFQEEMERSAIDIVAEKVEDEHTLVEILDYKIDFGQGYLFGEPRPAREI